MRILMVGAGDSLTLLTALEPLFLLLGHLVQPLCCSYFYFPDVVSEALLTQSASLDLVLEAFSLTI